MTFNEVNVLQIFMSIDNIRSEIVPLIVISDMPSGSVLLSLYSNDLIVCSKSVTYFTGMEEVNRYLESVTNPLEFFSQVKYIYAYAHQSEMKVFKYLNVSIVWQQ